VDGFAEIVSRDSSLQLFADLC